MHGYFYYPSKYGPVHPGLSFDLLGAQVDACRKRKIAVYAYYCTTGTTTWPRNIPNGCVVKRDGTNYLPKFDRDARLDRRCAWRMSDFVEADARAHARVRLALRTGWRMVRHAGANAGECFCPECLRALQAAGLDPIRHGGAAAPASQDLHVAFIKRVHATVQETRARIARWTSTSRAVFGIDERVPFMDNVDLEALPTARLGLLLLPVRGPLRAHLRPDQRYGMTGRFVTSWADFGGLKTAGAARRRGRQYRRQRARMCDIGDQMPPQRPARPGRLPRYRQVLRAHKALEPYLERAAPVTEAAYWSRACQPADMLDGSRTSACETADGMPCAVRSGRTGGCLGTLWADSAARRQAGERRSSPRACTSTSQAEGRSSWSSHNGGLLARNQSSWLERYRLYSTRVLPNSSRLTCCRERTSRATSRRSNMRSTTALRTMEGCAPAEVVAQLGEPAFQRSPQSLYQPRALTLSITRPNYAAIARSGRVALFGFPLGTSYFDRGYWVYRAAFAHVLKSVAPLPLVESNAPINAEVTVTHQSAKPSPRRPERYMVHVVNFSPTRGIAKHPTYHDDPTPLQDVKIRLNLPVKFKTVKGLSSGQALRPAKSRLRSGSHACIRADTRGRVF